MSAPRRAVLTISKQRRGYMVDSDSLRELVFGDQRADDEVYHFLLPVKEMAAVTRKELKTLVPEATKQGADWGKEHGQHFTEHEFAVLRELSAAIDELWSSVAASLHSQRAKYEATLPGVWPAKAMSGQDRAHRQLDRPDDYRRLKLALDYWCSLWFWPISKYDLLPPRHQFLLDMSLILTGRPTATEGTLSWVLETELKEVEESAVRTLLDDTDNPLEIDDLAEYMSGRLRVSEETAAEQRFLHWPLEFADMLWERSGFDLIVGNPPWVQIDWVEKEALALHAPSVVLRRWSADKISQERTKILGVENLNWFIIDARIGSALAAFSRHPYSYPILKGTGTNTYKLFLARCFTLISQSGIIGIVHPVDHLLEPKGNALKKDCYERLVLLLQFMNARPSYMFSDVHSRAVFAICIYCGHKKTIHFRMMTNIFAYKTVDESLFHDGAGAVPGIKDANGNWQLSGHRSRVIEINRQALASLGSILDPGTDATMCRLPMLHSSELAVSLVKITAQPYRLGDLKGTYLQDSMWHETGARKTENPLIRRETAFRNRPEDLILTGPVFGLANPIAKSPNHNCRSHQDYTDINLEWVSDDYLPRSNYTPALPWQQYRDFVRSVPWDESIKHVDCTRIALRGFVSVANERTLQCCIVGKGLAHVHTCESVAFKSPNALIQVCTLWNSLPYDFIAKSTQVKHLQTSFTSQLPVVELPDIAYHRMLQLNCLTTHHANIWNEIAPYFTQLSWSASHPGLELEDP